MDDALTWIEEQEALARDPEPSPVGLRAYATPPPSLPPPPAPSHKRALDLNDSEEQTGLASSI